MTADEIIETLKMQKHPEGGWYAETWRAENPGRASGTCIYFLLKADQSSHWHRVDAAEIWHYYAGAPLRLRLAQSEHGPVEEHTLTPNLAAGRPQVIVPAEWWQAAETLGDYTLVGCTVSPGFEYAGFELAPKGFDIP